MSTMFNIMNVPKVMHHKTYTEISSEVRTAALGAAADVMKQSSDLIRERHSCGMYATEQVSESGVQVVGVSYDGTWHKRGHSSHYGVGVAIDIDSGLVLDTHTVSNYCAGCNSAPPVDSDQYAAWSEKHRPVCNKNFTGSSNAMEMEAAEKIFSRSIADRNLIYGTISLEWTSC